MPVAYVTSVIYMALLMMPGGFTGLLSTELVLTDSRIIGKIGMFRKRLLTLHHKDIESARAQRGIVGYFFNYGSLTINSASGVRVKFKGIAKPHDLAQQINEVSEVAILGRTLTRIQENSVSLAKPRHIPSLTTNEQLPTSMPAEPQQSVINKVVPIESAIPKPVAQVPAAPAKPTTPPPKAFDIREDEENPVAPHVDYKDPNVW